MIDSPPSVDVQHSISEIAARIREWISLETPGIVWIRYVSDVSRERVMQRLSFGTLIEQIEFNPPEPRRAAEWLENELGKFAKDDSLTTVAVVFSRILEGGREGLAAAFQSLNMRREPIARLPLIQLWWIPVSDATTAELEALDLASWFQIRMSLTEIAP